MYYVKCNGKASKRNEVGHQFFCANANKDKVNFKHRTERRRLMIRNFFGNLQSNYKLRM